jgi:hypothetical protein
LQGILGIFLVSEQRIGSAVELNSITGEECRQCFRIASDGALNDVPLFAPWHWFCFLGDTRESVNARR